MATSEQGRLLKLAEAARVTKRKRSALHRAITITRTLPGVALTAAGHYVPSDQLRTADEVVRWFIREADLTAYVEDTPRGGGYHPRRGKLQKIGRRGAQRLSVCRAL